MQNGTFPQAGINIFLRRRKTEEKRYPPFGENKPPFRRGGGKGRDFPPDPKVREASETHSCIGAAGLGYWTG